MTKRWLALWPVRPAGSARVGTLVARQPSRSRSAALAAGLNLADKPDPEISEEDNRRAVASSWRPSGARARLAGLPLSAVVRPRFRPGDLVNLMRDPSGSGLANIRRVAEIASEFEATEGRDLRGLIEWIDERATGLRSRWWQPKTKSRTWYAWMTIHKSKGLEFPMVCVADLGLASKADSESVIWICHGTMIRASLRSDCDCPELGGPGLICSPGKRLKDQARTDKTDEEPADPPRRHDQSREPARAERRRRLREDP